MFYCKIGNGIINSHPLYFMHLHVCILVVCPHNAHTPTIVAMFSRPLRTPKSFAAQKSGTIVLARKASKKFCGAVFFIANSNLRWPWPMGPKLGLRANFWWESKVFGIVQNNHLSSTSNMRHLACRGPYLWPCSQGPTEFCGPK